MGLGCERESKDNMKFLSERNIGNANALIFVEIELKLGRNDAKLF